RPGGPPPRARHPLTGGAMTLDGILDEPTKPSYPRTPCALKVVADQLDGQEDQLELLDQLLFEKNPKRGGYLRSARLVSERLKERGFQAGNQQVSRHRSHSCSCW